MKIVACLGTNCTGEKEFTAAVDDVCRRLSGESGYICSCIYPSADADFPVGADARYYLNAVFEFEIWILPDCMACARALSWSTEGT